MSTEHRGRRQVWVGTIVCPTLRSAAALAGIPETTMFRHLRLGGGELNGVRIAETAPRREQTERPADTGPLLRYPPGQRPLDRGIGWNQWK